MKVTAKVYGLFRSVDVLERSCCLYLNRACSKHLVKHFFSEDGNSAPPRPDDVAVPDAAVDLFILETACIGLFYELFSRLILIHF